jgi:hypothetical protein
MAGTTTRFIGVLLFFLLTGRGEAQVFWTEDFTSGGTGWFLNQTLGGEASNANFFRVGQGEGGGITPDLGAPSSCGVSNNGNNSLHVTSTIAPNNGAAYNAGGLCGLGYCVTTNKRAESPTINCTGRSTITLNFNYIEGGQITTDNATLWYFDGTAWTQLDDMSKTLTGCGGQGLWISRLVNLPASANNNPSVKIAFRWVNNDDGVGTDPSFAVDDITLSAASSNTIVTGSVAPNRICAGGTVQVSFTSTGTFSAGNIYTAQLSNASGSFASPSILGTLSSTANSGSITGTIPVGLPAGTGYLVRVVSSNPSVVASVTAPLTVLALPADPSLLPDPACEGTQPQFTAGNGVLYEFFLDAVSQGSMSAVNTFTPAGPLTEGSQVCVRSYSPMPFTFDGLIEEAEWGLPLATSAGGPATSGFGNGNNMDAIYLSNGYGFLFGAIAGALINQSLPDKILLFIDSKPGGYNNLGGWTNRGGVPYKSMENLNNGITFDAGFEPDFILGINGNFGDEFFDLYDMQLNALPFQGTDNGSAFLGYTANAGTGDYSKGFEFAIPLSALGNPGGTIKVFAMIVNEPDFALPTFLSNQFLTRANNGEGNYTDGFVDFNAAAPNPITYNFEALCYAETCLTVQPVREPEFDPIGPFCQGDLLPPGPLLPETDKNGLTGTWSGSPSTDNPGDFNFTFTPDDPCANTKTITITIKPIPTTTNIFHD